MGGVNTLLARRPSKCRAQRSQSRPPGCCSASSLSPDPAGVGYRLWLRGKATADYWANDSVFIQFNDSVDENGQPKVEIASADFGPLPAPEGLRDAVAAMVREAYMGSLGPVATGLRIETIAIADGVMTISGRIK